MLRAAPLRRVSAPALAFLLPVLYSPSVSGETWTPRAALLLMVIAIGLPLLPRLARPAARSPALAAVALLAVAGVSAGFARRPALAVFGLYDWGTGLLFVVALVSAWCLGKATDERGVDAIERALLAAVGINVVVALIQAAFDLHTAPFTRYQGRSAGLLGNPVHLGTLCVAAMALLLPRVRAEPRRWGVALALVAAALELSGSRFALALAVAVGAVVIARERRRAIPFAAALALGVVLGVGLGAAGGTATGTGRVAGGAEVGGVTPRLRVWASARHSIVHRPLLGVGPGQFRSATSPYRDLALVRAEGPDHYFVDAHDMLVEYATTIGLLGVACLVIWLVLAARGASGPLLGFAGLALAMHLVQPQFVGTTPLALLALGASARVPIGKDPGARAVTAVLVAAALVASGSLLFGDFELNQAALDFRISAAVSALRFLPPWPEPADLAGRVAFFDSQTSRSATDRRDALRRYRQAVKRDPTNPGGWSQLGGTQLAYGLPRAAEVSFRQALRWDPWSLAGLNGLGTAALAVHDQVTAEAAFRRSLRAQPAQPNVRRQLAVVARR